MSWVLRRLSGRARVPMALPGLPLAALHNHLLLLGQSGSGKTILFKQIARAVLESGAGCFLPCAKLSDWAWAEPLVHATGRTADLVVLRPGGGVCVNPLAGLPGGDPGTVGVECASLTLEVVRALLGLSRGQDSEGGFWTTGQQVALVNTFGLVAAADPGVPPTLAAAKAVLDSAPLTPAAVASERYRAGLNAKLCERAWDRGGQRFVEYFQEVLPNIPDKTQGGFLALPRNGLDILSVGCAGELFAPAAGRPPLDLGAAMDAGKVVVALYPPGVYEQGAAVYGALKRGLLGPALTRRVTAATRPFYLLLDEFPQYASPADARLLETVRSSKVPVVMACQGIESLEDKLGRKETALSIVGNTGVKVHTRPTAETCRWVCEGLGQRLGATVSGSTAGADPQGFADYWQGSPGSVTAGYSQQMLNLLNPSDFAAMRCGSDSPRDVKTVDYLLVPGGGGRPFRKCSYTRAG